MRNKIEKFIQRKARVKTKVSGSPSRPRLSVFRSNKYLYAQIIDDTKGKTLVSASSSKIKEGTNIEKAAKVGEALAKKAAKAKIKKVAFDRSGYKYHGIIKALAEAARKGGLEF